jgi:hypothetical protein
MTKGRTAQALKKIVRRAVLLKYHDNVLKRIGIGNTARLLGLANTEAEETDYHQKSRRVAAASHSFSNRENTPLGDPFASIIDPAVRAKARGDEDEAIPQWQSAAVFHKSTESVSGLLSPNLASPT